MRWVRRAAGAAALATVAAATSVATALPAHAAAAQLTRAPYLTDVVGSVATVNWGTDTTGTATVTYGPAAAGCSGATANGTATAITVATKAEQQWSAQLTGLSPSTSYCYSISQDGTSLLSSTPHFTSALATGSTGSFSFAVLGDWGEATNGVNTDQQKVLEQVAKSGVQFALGTGDIGYGDASQTDYGDLQNTGGNSEVFRSGFWGVPGGSVPMFTAIGNHGWNSTFLQNWPEPTAVTSSSGTYSLDASGDPQAWYAFDEGNARFYVLEAAAPTAPTQYADDDTLHWSSDSPQLTWLQNDLAAHPGTLKVAVFHYPLWSDDSTDSDTLLQSDLLPVLDHYGVRLVFNGHSHIYERNNAYTGGSVNGLVSYVSGGAGADTEDISQCSAYDAYAIGWSTSGTSCHAAAPTSVAQVHHFLKVTVNASTVTVAPTDENGNVFDQQTYDFAPGAPTALSATAGSSHVALSWSAPTSNGGSAVSGYTVYRSSSPSAAATAIASGVTTTSYDDTTATAGSTYYYTVRATNAAGLTGPLSSQASATPYAAPAAPTGLAATPVDGGVDLSWTAPSGNGSAVSSYTVYRSSVSGDPGTAVAHPTATSFNDTGLANGTTYYYTVTATNAAGEGPGSTQTPATPRAVPSAPTGAVAAPGDRSAALTWTAPTDDGGSTLTGYDVYRSTDGTRGGLVGTPTTTRFDDVGLSNGTTYYYTVTATNAAGEGPGVQVSTTPRTTPAAPTGLTATPQNSSTQLTWSAPGDDGGAPITGYTLYRSATAGDPGIAVAHPSTTSFTDTGLANGTTYYYTVTATNAAGEGPGATQTPATPRTAPSAVGGLTATPDDASVSLGWSTPSGNGSAISSYTVYRSSVSGDPGTAIAHPTTTNFTDTGLTNGTTYYYTVTATNAAGEGPGSTQTPATPRTVPAAVAGLIANPGNATVALSWTAPSDDGGATVTSYSVYRSTDGSRGTLVGTPTATAFGDSGLVNGVTYYYTVAAVNVAGEGAAAQVSSKPRTKPGAPTGLAGKAQNTEVALTWSAPSSDGGATITGYTVYRSTTDGQLGSPIAHPTGASFTDTGLINGTTYHYTVTATNAAGEGPDSSQVSATPLAVPNAPSSLAASAAANSVSMTWNAPADNGSAITAYAVYRSTTSGVLGSPIAHPTGSSFTDTGLTNGTTYYYTVTATNAAGEGPDSGQVSTTPRTVPSAPTAVSASFGDGTVSLTWAAPADDGGATVASYVVYRSTDASLGARIGTSTSTTYTDTGLTDGQTYYYTLAAVNEAGEGPGSVQRAVTPATVPGAPTTLSAAASDQRVDLSWAVPANDGGRAVTSYKVYRSTDGVGWTALASTGTTTWSDPRVTDGVSYDYAVSAVNAIGEGARTAAVTATPYGGATVTITSGPRPTDGASATFTFATSDPNGLAVTTMCSLDGAPAVACLSGQTYSGLTDGAHRITVTVRDAAAPGGDAAYTWVVDTAAPKASLRRLSTVTFAATVVFWSATDSGTGVGSYDVRYRRAGRDGRFGGWNYPRAWQGLVTTTLTRAQSPGHTVCFSVRARDVAGNVSGWTAPTCTSRPLDDRAFTTSSGWRRESARGFYLGTATTNVRAGARLAAGAIGARRIALIATTCRACGSVRVYLGGRLVGFVSLRANRTTRRAVVWLPAFARRTGTLTIRIAWSGRMVEVDGVAVLP